MNIFGLYITRASTLNKERDAATTAIKSEIEVRRKESRLWDKIMSKLLWENFNLRKALR